MIPMLMLAVAHATPAWKPVWSGAVDRFGGMPQVELLGVDDEGDTAWLRVSEGPRSTQALWQIDLEEGRRTGVWSGEGTTVAAFGALAPLVDGPADLARFGLLQAHIAGRPTWPALNVDPSGRWLAWEHGDARGGDAVTLRDAEGPGRLGDEALTAVYRPRFHPELPWVAYTGSNPKGDYQVVVESVATGERLRVDGVAHATQLDWDAHGALWVTGEGCVARVPADELASLLEPAVLHGLETLPVAEAIACGSGDLHSRTSPDGRSIIVVDASPTEAGQLLVGRFRTDDGSLVGRAQVRGGRSAQALSDDGWLLVTTLEGASLVAITDDGVRNLPLDVAAQGAMHDHWPGGRALALVWDPVQRVVTLGWAEPPAP